MNPLAIAGLGFAAIYLLKRATQASAVSQMKFLLTNVKPTWQGLSGYLECTVLIQNPTSTVADVRSVVAELAINDQKMGNVTSFSPIKIAPNGQTEAKLTVRLNSIDIAMAIQNLFTQNKQPVIGTVKGTVNVDGSNVPLDITYKLI